MRRQSWGQAVNRMIQACGCSLRFLWGGWGGGGGGSPTWRWQEIFGSWGHRQWRSAGGTGPRRRAAGGWRPGWSQSSAHSCQWRGCPVGCRQTNPTRRRQPSTNSPSGSCRLRPDVLHKSGYCYLHAKVHCDSQFYLPHSKVQESKEWHHINSEAPLVAASSTNGPSTCLESVQQQGQLESEKGWGCSHLTWNSLSALCDITKADLQMSPDFRERGKGRTSINSEGFTGSIERKVYC